MYKLCEEYIDPLDGFNDFSEYCFAHARGAKLEYLKGVQHPCEIRVLYEQKEEVYCFSSHNIENNTSEINEMISLIKQNDCLPFAISLAYIATDGDDEQAIFIIGANKYEEQAFFIKSIVTKQDYINGGERPYYYLFPSLFPLLKLIGITSTSVPKEKLCNKRKVKFGRYPQKSNTDMSDISWFVVSEDEDKMLLVSEYALDCKPYNETNSNCDWATCSLRKWLNSNFLNAAFNEAEQKAIIEEAHCSPEKNSFNISRIDDLDGKPFVANPYNISAGQEVIDKVFILDSKHNPQIFEECDYRIVLPTQYAVNNGAIIVDKKYPRLWARSFGNAKNKTEYINDEGFNEVNGINVNSRHIGVRPAVWVKKEFFAPKTKAPTTTQKPNNNESIAKRRQNLGLCQHCGGNFKGLFRKKCSSCGKLKDY